MTITTGHDNEGHENLRLRDENNRLTSQLVRTQDYMANHLREKDKEIERLTRINKGLLKELHEVDQVLGKALGYPWYKDDQNNFPGATEADGVCTGHYLPIDLAFEIVNKLDLDCGGRIVNDGGKQCHEIKAGSDVLRSDVLRLRVAMARAAQRADDWPDSNDDPADVLSDCASILFDALDHRRISA